jgi:S-adenosylmethionine-diacylglycerol 3-amino-3-carboxypropyl transferase
LKLPPDAIGEPDTIATLGPDYAGRYERCFAALQAELAPKREELRAILGMSLRDEQLRQFAPETTFGKHFDSAIDNVMSLENLVALFGSGATQNPAEPFSRHFARRIRHALATLPANTNPFLWQMLLGEYPAGHAADWFALPAPAKLPQITWQQAFMLEALRTQTSEFDVVHLSNILDWLSPEEATATLAHAAQALRPGGQVVIRQLNSTLDIPASGPMFAWEDTRELHASDRSFFYRGLHIGRKK